MGLFGVDPYRVPLTGLAAAKARGRLGGRKLKLSPAQVKHALNLYFSNEKSVRDICSIVGISRGQFYEYLKKTVLSIKIA